MADPLFLQVQVGDAVLVEPRDAEGWVGQVIHREGGARCNGNSFFQIADVDSGRIQTVNPNLVTGIVRKGHGELPLAASEAHRPRKAPIRSSQSRPVAHRELELSFLGRAC